MTSLSELVFGYPIKRRYKLINPKKKAKKKDYKNSGVVSLLKCFISKGESFIDFIKVIDVVFCFCF